MTNFLEDLRSLAVLHVVSGSGVGDLSWGAGSLVSRLVSAQHFGAVRGFISQHGIPVRRGCPVQIFVLGAWKLLWHSLGAVLQHGERAREKRTCIY